MDNRCISNGQFLYFRSMSDWPAYSRKQWSKAVNLSALLGYLAVVGVPSILRANTGANIGGASFGHTVCTFVLLGSKCADAKTPYAKRNQQDFSRLMGSSNRFCFSCV